jgi:hypothetical protein
MPCRNFRSHGPPSAQAGSSASPGDGGTSLGCCYPKWLRGELVPGLVVAVLLGITFGVVGWSIVITWIYNNTHSVFWIILLHGWNNTIQSYLVLSAGFLANVIFALLPWVVAIYLLRKYGGKTLRGRPVATAAESGTG